MTQKPDLFRGLIASMWLGNLMLVVRRALLISRGDPSVFVTRPISLGFMIATIVIMIVMLMPAIRARREAITD